MNTLTRSAYEDCLELLEDSVDALDRALTSVAGGDGGGGSGQDVVTWLSAALTNQETCGDGFEEGGPSISGSVKSQMGEKLKDLAELVSNCLAIFSGTVNDDFSGVPIQNKRKLLAEEDDISGDFPKWLSRKERKLLDTPISAIQADIVVSKDGNGTYKTIAEAIKKAPEFGERRTIIYVRAGR